MKKITTVMVNRPFYHIIAISEKEKIKEDKAYYFEKIAKRKHISNILKEWRNVILERKEEDQRIYEINNHFLQSPDIIKTNMNNSEAEVTFELENSINESPEYKYSVKTEVQITLIKSFQEFSETSVSALERKYFSILKLNTKMSKIYKEQYEYAEVYYLKKTKDKFLKLMIETYNDKVQERENIKIADEFYKENTLFKYWGAFQEGLRNSKKENLCQKTKSRGLKVKILKELRKNVAVNKKCRLLEERLEIFSANRSEHLLKHCYFTWKNKHILENYYKTAVEEFSEYREKRVKKFVLRAI